MNVPEVVKEWILPNVKEVMNMVPSEHRIALVGITCSGVVLWKAIEAGYGIHLKNKDGEYEISLAPISKISE